jgi:hypothetical protein
VPARAPTSTRIERYASSVGEADTRRSLPKLIFGVVSEALRTAGRTMNDVDGVVIATHELIDGRSLSDGDAAGERLSDEKRVSVEFSDKPRGMSCADRVRSLRSTWLLIIGGSSARF